MARSRSSTTAWAEFWERLDELGLAKDTLVVFTADHGRPAGEITASISRDPRPTKACSGSGLILRGPGIEAGRVVPDPVVDGGPRRDLLRLRRDRLSRRNPEPVAQTGHGRRREPGGRLQRMESAPQPHRDRIAASDGSDGRCEIDLGYPVRKRGRCTTLRATRDELENLFDDAARHGLRRELIDTIRARPGTILSEFPEHRE